MAHQADLVARAPARLPADTSSEAWRLECEARQVLSWPLDQRRTYLADVQQQRGAAAADALKAEIERQWKARRCAA